MKKISSAYWEKFINIDSDGNEKGNGIEFENLVNCLLVSMYRKKWVVTGGSHDNNRDFWLYSENQHLWAECKNYSNTIAMNILAPTLVMAQIYEVNEILFFSRSTINRFAKNKILAFGEKTNKMIRFFDGVTLEALICTYASELPKKYSPVKYMSDCEIAKVDDSFVNVFFFQNAVSSVHHALEDFQNYTSAEKIYYNETFALTFSLLNPFQEDQVDVYIEFMDEESDRFSFQYFYPTIKPEDKGWYHACLKKGEGRAVSLNMRQSVYKPEIMLPRFHIAFVGAQSGNRFEWHSEKVIVKSHWVGSTRLIGNNYLKILDDTKHLLVNNPSLKAWFRSKEAYDTIQAYYPCALSEDLKFYRPFIHFCCDIAVQKHMYKQEVDFLREVLKMCNNAHPVGFENQDELNVLRAIMYNRWYISYNTESYKQEIVSVREVTLKIPFHNSCIP